MVACSNGFEGGKVRSVEQDSRRGTHSKGELNPPVKDLSTHMPNLDTEDQLSQHLRVVTASFELASRDAETQK